MAGSNLLSDLLQAFLKYPLKIINSEQQGILLSGCRVKPVMFSPPHQLSSSFPSAVADVLTLEILLLLLLVHTTIKRVYLLITDWLL